jgi:hypothetical protein
LSTFNDLFNYPLETLIILVHMVDKSSFHLVLVFLDILFKSLSTFVYDDVNLLLTKSIVFHLNLTESYTDQIDIRLEMNNRKLYTVLVD